jgi:serine/threonine-protein kinase HipA
MLFVRRFDRVVTDDGLNRLHQESLASLAGHRGFGIKTSHNELLMAMRQYVDNPLQETVEYLKRDALNQALRNTDNHAHNTAVQRHLDGTVSLTPLFDFAPMYKDPEMIPRAVHWKDQQGNVMTDWLDIFNTLELPQHELEYCAKELLAFADVIDNLHELCLSCGVDKSVVEECSLSINKVANSLYSLAYFNRV